MQIILLKDVPKVGSRGQVVTVSEGYALNFLIPKGLARAATPSAVREIEMVACRERAAKEAQDVQLKEGVESVNGKTVTLHAKANEQGHLFAALRDEDISSAIYDQHGILFPKSAIALPEPVKVVGDIVVNIIGGGAKSAITVRVEAAPQK